MILHLRAPRVGMQYHKEHDGTRRAQIEGIVICLLKLWNVATIGCVFLLPWTVDHKVPKVGIEPTHPKVHDFESCASTNSATLATYKLLPSYAGCNRFLATYQIASTTPIAIGAATLATYKLLPSYADCKYAKSLIFYHCVSFTNFKNALKRHHTYRSYKQRRAVPSLARFSLSFWPV